MVGCVAGWGFGWLAGRCDGVLVVWGVGCELCCGVVGLVGCGELCCGISVLAYTGLRGTGVAG